MNDPAFTPHNHAACAAGALARAEALLAERGAKLTPVRRGTLEILLEGHRALGAYDILARLSERGFGTQPPVAYRALDFLEQHGLVHRIRRLNAFVACAHAGDAHAPMFLICRLCNEVAEGAAAPLRAALEAAASSAGFAVEQTTLEAVGLCAACRDGGQA